MSERPAWSRLGAGLVVAGVVAAVVAAALALTRSGDPDHVAVIVCLVAATVLIILGLIFWLNAKIPRRGPDPAETVGDDPASAAPQPATGQPPVAQPDQAQGLGWMKASDLAKKSDAAPGAGPS